ncbi:hypothetical protein N7533_009604 [Penicillium manginii]|uniref:uncharacterized protein n=1 Tax=Penicillium manginii TaxID=203109 RepID=UPI002546F7F5|nr:uncharacterized protein N7533_009604 [Penicillium manginii]KAJ5744734.1 hypothetical protein N7533_009604 [Penicillium manginii]
MAIPNKQDPIVLVIDFHHARGPEIEHCIANEGANPATDNDWSLLPFMALSDGAHLSTEEFSYFTLRGRETPDIPETSLFGIACSRQLDAKLLLNRPPDVTRSTVQKAVVVVTDSPQRVGQLREKLSVVTTAWFAQRDFSDIDILKKFHEGLVISLMKDGPKDQNLGLSLREMIHEFKYQTLVLFKALLLQPKMLFFGTRCERLCMLQFSLISLIPGLINHLEDCADPSFDSYAQSVEKPTSLKTSDRSSLLAYMGLPLQIFGKGSMFGPYTPLQQLDLLADDGTKSYVVGSTNSLLLQQKDRYSDILINFVDHQLDEDSISISSLPLRNALALSTADRRWIDLLTQIVNDTWDEDHPSRPKTLGFMGSEEFIRLQFEEYLLALLSSMKYHEELSSYTSGDSGHRSRAQLQNFNIEGDPAVDFNTEFLIQWQKTSNYALFSRLTSDALLFSITEPRHPSAGGLTVDDIQRRLSQQVADLHLDEKVREGREALGRHLATGQKKVSAVYNRFWSDMETGSIDDSTSETSGAWFASRPRASIDVAQAQATAAQASQKAGAYFSSWGSWANEKRREWQEKRSASPSPQQGAIAPSPSAPSLSIVSETITESDRGRRRSMQRESEDTEGGLSRSLSRRKRWSNILLRRESGEFKRDESADSPFPKSPLSQGFPAHGLGTEENPFEAEKVTGQQQQQLQAADAEGFTSVSLTPNEGLRVDLNPSESTAAENTHDSKKTADSRPDDSLTALPVKEKEQSHEAKDSISSK